MRTTLAVFCLSLISIVAHCQNEFQPGYILKNNKDTIKGFIEFYTESNLSKEVKFKHDMNSALEIFSPTDIAGFFITNDKFISIGFLNTFGEEPVRDRCFAKQIVSGPIELFTFQHDEIRFYIVKQDTVSYLLFSSVYGNPTEGVRQGNYISRLALLETHCKDMKSRYLTVGFTQKEMSDYIRDLNNCISPGSSVSSYHKTKLVTHVFAYVGGLPLGEQSQVTAEAGLRFSSPKINRHVFLNLGLHYSFTTSTTIRLNGGNLPYKSSTMAKVYSVPLTFQYNFFTGRFRPYVYAGLSGAFIDLKTDGVVTNPQGFQQGYGLAFVAGAGVEIRIIAGLFIRGEYRYELTSQFPSFGIHYEF